jgi:diacylglycerol kinase family enzyme
LAGRRFAGEHRGYGHDVPGTIIVNPRAGQGSVTLDELRDLFPGHRVEACEPLRLERHIDEIVASGADFVGVAGGDGTIGTVAGRLAGSGTPLLAIPGGTRNHFARGLGHEQLEDAVRAAEHGEIRHVDLGEVAGHTFVNNASIGLYPAMVRRRELHERRYRKGLSNLLAIVEQIRHGRQFAAEIDGERHRAWAVFVGNGRYGDTLVDLVERESLDLGVLDVRIVAAARRFSRVRVLAATLAGRLSRSPLVERLSGTSVCVDLRQHEVDVALDGEVHRLTTPLVFQSRPRTLRVLVAPARDTASPPTSTT